MDTTLNNAFMLFCIHNPDLPFTSRHWYSILCLELLKAAGKEQEEEDKTAQEELQTILLWNQNTKVAHQRYVTPGTPEYKELL